METRAHSGRGADPPLSVRFGPFELDLRSAELYKDGRKVRLQEQPYQILRMLLESPGEVVSREEIRNRLWPDDTIVEFDHSISAAVKRLRDTLRDSAEKPRYIETLARRGYRFIGEVGPSDQPCRAPVSVSNGDQKNQMVAPSIDRSALRIQNLRILIAVLFSVVLALDGAWYYSRRVRTSPLQPLIRLDVDLGNNTVSPGSERGPDAILSPDGTQLVYVSRSKLFTRRLDQASTTELPGTEMAQSPFFSPDGKWVAFFAGEKLKKASTRGGQVIELCNAPIGSAAGGGNWGEDGNIVAAVNLGLARIPAAGEGGPRSVES